MFGSRKKGRKQYTPPTAATVNPNAATAAVSAYKLSSAAAAAALRALPATPTDVSAVQTKRTQRRSASLSSEGSRRALSPGPSIKRVMGLGGGNASSEQRNGRVASPLGVPTLRRRGSASSMRSVSSMSERTFRSPSPHQSRGYTHPSITSSPGGSVTGSRKPPINAAGAAAAAAAERSAAGTSGLGSRSRSVPPPPVPTIPQHVIDNHPSSPPELSNTKLKKSRRITSLGFVQQPLRLASQKQQSQGNSRSSWFGPGAVGDVSDIRTSDQPMDINGYAHASDDQRPTSPTERPGSRSSLHNFSYPSRQRLSSPPASPTHSRNTSLTESVGTAGAASATALPLRKTNSILRSVSTERAPKQQTSKSSGAAASRRSASTSRVPGHSHGSSSSEQELVYDANSRRMVPRGQLLMLEESIYEAPVRPQQPQQVHQQQQPRPQRKKKQQHVQQQQSQTQSQAKTPTHQKQASPVATVVPSSSTQDVPSVASVTKSRTAPVESEKRAPESRIEGPTIDNVDEAVQPVPALSTSASTPSSSVSSLPVLASTQTTSPAIQSQKSAVDSTADSESFAPEDNRPVLIKRPSIVHEDPEREEEEGRHLHNPVPVDSEQSRSRSPLRTAHFSPIVANNLTVLRHSPPPRSISPRKSAMKQTSSPRDTSPSDSASDAAAVPYQPPTNAEILKRKKANRVSFDEKATVLSGPPTSPIQPASPASSLPGAAEAPASSHTAHQPPTRSRSWFSNMGRSKKKTTNDASIDDDDVVMKPRPALPSFGSVRDKPFPTSQQEERALVKPNDNQPPSRLSTTSSPPPPSVLKSTPLETLDSSSDHAIGSIISSSQGQAASAVTRNTANTSRYREPLPPVVTSVDGNGYVSDSGANTSSDDDDDEASATARVVPDSDDEEHLPVLRFDEEQDTTVPAPISSAFAATTDSAGDFAQQVLTANVPRPTSPSSKNTVPAISVSHPSQENLVAVRGTDSDDEDAAGAAYSDAPAVAMPSNGHPSSPVRSLFDVPGTFPDTDSDSTRKSSPTQADFNNTAVPVRQDAFEPITQNDDLTYSPQMPATVFATHMPTLHEEAPLSSEKVDEEDSDSEVFSDAYEDLSDIEGDGFLSLDAVVDSPIVPTFSKSPFGSSILTGSPPRKQDSVQLEPSFLPGPISSPSSAPNIVAAASTVVGGTSASMSALMASAASKSAGMSTMNPDDKDDWDKVKAFWRGLSAEKRAQLESVAREDAAADGDLEEESSADIKKPRRKKSVETRLAEKKAIQESSLSTTSKATETNEEAVTSPVEHKTEAVAATRIRRSMRDKATAGSVEEKETGGPGLMPSTLRRRGSDSSESSFKRARGPGAGLRKSLRTEPKPTTTNTDAITLANTAANENLDRRGSRFSLRSLSPTGSTTLRGSTESSPQFRRTLRDGPGFAASEAKRMSSPGPMANATLRKGAGSESSGGFFSSLGRKSGGKLLQRSKNPGGDGKSFSRTRFGDSSDDDDDDDVFRPSSGHGNSSARRTTSAGAYTFRSRFVDSSDEDEVVSEQRIARPQGKNYVVPKTMRGAPSNGISNTSLRPGSSSAAKGPQVPERLTEAAEDEAQKSANRTKSPQPAARNTFPGLSKSGAASANAPGNGNIGTTTLRRTRSGRGQMMVPMSPGYSPTTTGVTGVGLGARAPSPTRHRRASSIMSVLRRKKPDTTSSAGYVGGIGRGELVDSAARRDTQLERNTQELAAMRSSSVGSRQRQRSLNRTLRGGNGSSGSTPRIMPLDGEDSDDLDEDDSEDGPRRAANGGARSASNVNNVNNVNNSWPLRGPGTMANNLDFLNDSASNLGSGSLQQKKKKFPALRRMFRLND